MTTANVAEALHRAAATLGAAGVARPRLDARLLLAHVLRIGPEGVIAEPERPVDPAALKRLARLTARRARREPVARILGTREFWSLPFKLTPDTLDPRPDSETVVESALAALAAAGVSRPLRLLDLGTGTGCLLLALLHELPNARGLGVDIDAKACAAAAANAASLGLERRAWFAAGDWGRATGGAFNLIVANPPYVPDGCIDALQPEVARYEPRRALAGGADGLDCYRALAPDLARLLAPDGLGVVEIGAGQAGAVMELFAAAGLEGLGAGRDLAGIERCVVLSKSTATEKLKKSVGLLCRRV